jgi:hypothetical protein
MLSAGSLLVAIMAGNAVYLRLADRPRLRAA